MSRTCPDRPDSQPGDWLWGQHSGPAAGFQPSAPGRLLCTYKALGCLLWLPLPPLSGSILLSHPPLPRIPCCATWSPQGQGVTNCQVMGGHLESAAWGWSHGEGSARNSTPRPDTAWPCFSLEISTLPRPAEWPSATSSSLRCPGRLRLPPRPRAGSHPQASIRVYLQGHQLPPPPPGSPTQAGPQPVPFAVLLSCLSFRPHLPSCLWLVSRWLAQSPGRGRMLLPTAQEKLRHRGDWTHWAPGPAHQASHITHSCPVRSPGL